MFIPVNFKKMLANSRVLVFSNALKKVSGCVADIICIAQILPFTDQVAANAVRRQFHDLSNKIRPTLEPVFVSRKLENDLKPREVKPSIVNQQCVVYHFSCDLCDADYVGYTARHLFQRVAEHKNSAIGKHFLEVHGNKHLLNEGHFKILRKCQSKFDCLIFEMLFIKKIKPCLNTQADSIRAKLFV